MQDFKPIKQSYRDFAAKHALGLVVTKLGYREKGVGAWENPHFAFNCYLSKGTWIRKFAKDGSGYEKVFQPGANGITTSYQVGVGVPMTDKAVIAQAKRGYLPSLDVHSAGLAVQYYYGPRVSLAQDAVNKRMIRAAELVYEPDIVDILHSMQSDLSCVYYQGTGFAVDFQGFCYELGYNSDSIKDKQCYEAVMEQSQALLRLLGREAIEELLGLEGL